jgi:hypothetical protein
MCDHVCDTTSRYDADAKLLTFLLFCPECNSERVIETLSYEPRFKPMLVLLSGGKSSDLNNPAPATLRLAA